MLTQDRIDAFHRDGYLIMRDVIRGRELDDLQEAADRVVAEGVSGQGQDHLRTRRSDGSWRYRRSERIWDRDPAFRVVTVNPDLLENVAQCIGASCFPWNDSLVVKVPGDGEAVVWHQDPPYGQRNRTSISPVPNFTTDIYLDHADPENGCVWAIPGHHLVGNVAIEGHTQDQMFAARGAVPLVMAPGDVLFHCLSTPHGSRINRSDRQRRTFYIHYLTETVYQDAYGKESWSASKPGWGPVKRAQVAAMIEERTLRGLEPTCARGSLTVGEHGICVRSEAITPPRHWADLAARITDMDRERQRLLEAAGPALQAGNMV